MDTVYFFFVLVTVRLLLNDKRSPNLRKVGGRLNKKDGLTRYGNSHVKDKTS